MNMRTGVPRRSAQLLVLLLVAVSSIAPARAEVHVEVLDTYPEGQHIVLGPGQRYDVHLRCSSDQSLRVSLQPYLRSKPANAGNNGVHPCTAGEDILAWFFLASADAAVDEIRVLSYEENLRHGSVVLTLPADITFGRAAGDSGPEPDWLTRLTAREAEQRREAYDQSMNQPSSPIGSILVALLMLGMLGLCIFGIVLSVRALRRWSGPWWVAAFVPIGLTGLVVLRLVVDLSRDPTSHNLWPFEFLMVGGLSLAIMVALRMLRRFAGLDP